MRDSSTEAPMVLCNDCQTEDANGEASASSCACGARVARTWSFVVSCSKVVVVGTREGSEAMLSSLEMDDEDSYNRKDCLDWTSRSKALGGEGTEKAVADGKQAEQRSTAVMRTEGVADRFMVVLSNVDMVVA